MRVLALLLAFTGLGRAHPIDDWVANAELAEVRVIVPRIGALLEPLAAVVMSARKVPALNQLFTEQQSQLAVPITLLEPQTHAEKGLRLDGPLFFARAKRGSVLFLPITKRVAVVPYLTTVLEADPQPTKIGGEDGWLLEESPMVYRPGMVLAGQSLHALTPYLDIAEATASTLKSCAAQPGEADLFVLYRGSIGEGCATLRIDADRVHFDLRFEPSRTMPAIFGSGDGSLLSILGDQLTGAFSVHLSPSALAPYVQTVPGAQAIIEALDGRIAVGQGPQLGELTAVVGVKNAARLEALLTERLQSRVGYTVEHPKARTWKIQTKDSVTPKGLPQLTTAWIILEDTTLRFTTHTVPLSSAKKGLHHRPSTPGRLAMTMLKRPVLAVYNQPGGIPHNGRAIVDGWRQIPGQAGGEAMVSAATVWAWLGAHIGEWAIVVHQEGPVWTVSAEVMVL